MAQNGAILLEAHSLINGERQGEYGEPCESFRRIAAMWSAYLGKEVTGHDVGCMMALLKLARDANRHKPDNLIDAAGYIGLAADLPDIGIENGELAKLKEVAEEVCCYAGEYWDIHASPKNNPDCDTYEIADLTESGCGHVCEMKEEAIAHYIATVDPATILAMIDRIENRQGKIKS